MQGHQHHCIRNTACRSRRERNNGPQDPGKADMKPGDHATVPSLLLECVTTRSQRPTRHSGTMTTPESTTFIIVGLTKEGRKFRPSDWAERLCGVMSAFGAEHKVKYSPYVGPGDYNGHKAVFVDGRLGEIQPMAYRFMFNFAQDNDLQIVDGVCPLDGKK